MKAKSRRLLASLGLILWLGVYVWAGATIGSHFAAAPVWAQIAYFAVAGIAWIIPLRFVFDWVGKAPDSPMR